MPSPLSIVQKLDAATGRFGYDLMGHTDPKMTQKYIHLANADLQRTVDEATKGYLA
jgi:hypothetical protein